MAFRKQLEVKYSKQRSTIGDLKMFMSSTTCRMTKEFPQAMMALASSEVDNTKLTTTKSFKTSRCAPPLVLDTSMYALTSIPRMAGKLIVHSVPITKGARLTTAWPAP